MERIRVLLVGPSMSITGGQSVHAKQLLEGLSASEVVDVGFLAVNPSLPWPFIFLQKVKYIRTMVTSIAYLVSLVRKVRHYDIVHAYSASYWSFLLAPLPALVIGKLFGKATVLNYHSGEADDHLSNWWFVVPVIRRLATSIVVPSGYLVDVFGRFGLVAASIPNAIDLNTFRNERRERASLNIFCNRNHEAHYDVECVLRAFLLIQELFPNATLTIAGDGSLRATLESYATAKKLKATFVGKVSQKRMSELYAAADVYVNTPKIDNMPISILEAFASGVPVVTTDAGGIPWVVRNESNGLVVPVGDHLAVAGAIERILRDRTLALYLSETALADCEAYFTWWKVKQQWEKLYTSLN